MCRVGLKAIQPMQLHWASRLWGARAMVFGKVVNFCQMVSFVFGMRCL